MAQEKVSNLPVEAIGVGENDWMLVSKEIAPLVYESEKINPNNLFYDSGYKNIPFFNGVYGVANIGQGIAFTTMTIRIINRTVYIGGNYILPLATNAGGMTLFDDWSIYNSGSRSAVPFIYQGDGGFDVQSNGEIVQQNQMLPPILHPQVTTILLTSAICLRSLNVTGGRYPMQTYIPKAFLSSNGKMGITPPVGAEGNGNQSLSITSPLSELCSIFTIGDRLPNYANYGSGFTGGVSNRLNITQHTQPGRNSPLTIDARLASNYGGFFIPYNSQYHLDENTPIDLIISAFDAL